MRLRVSTAYPALAPLNPRSHCHGGWLHSHQTPRVLALEQSSPSQTPRQAAWPPLWRSCGTCASVATLGWQHRRRAAARPASGPLHWDSNSSQSMPAPPLSEADPAGESRERRPLCPAPAPTAAHRSQQYPTCESPPSGAFGVVPRQIARHPRPHAHAADSAAARASQAGRRPDCRKPHPQRRQRLRTRRTAGRAGRADTQRRQRASLRRYGGVTRSRSAASHCPHKQSQPAFVWMCPA